MRRTMLATARNGQQLLHNVEEMHNATADVSSENSPVRVWKKALKQVEDAQKTFTMLVKQGQGGLAQDLVNFQDLRGIVEAHPSLQRQFERSGISFVDRKRKVYLKQKEAWIIQATEAMTIYGELVQSAADLKPLQLVLASGPFMTSRKMILQNLEDDLDVRFDTLPSWTLLEADSTEPGKLAWNKLPPGDYSQEHTLWRFSLRFQLTRDVQSPTALQETENGDT